MQILMSTVNARFDPVRAGVEPKVFVVVNQLLADGTQGEAGGALKRYDRAFAQRFAALDENTQRGLSRSRNRALDLASEEICLFGDDDQVYVPDVCARIEDAFARHPQADIITFMEKTAPGGPWRKPYPGRRRSHSVLSVGKVRMPEIAFRLSRVKEAGLRLDETFGVGARYVSGDELLFLLDALRSGLKLIFLPELISYHPMNSTAARGATDENVMYSKGALMKRSFGKLAPLAICAFAARKMYQRRTLSPTLLRQMFKGWAHYKNARQHA